MRRLLDSALDALVPKVRTDPSGAKSLAHVCVVVPTAQSGRRLRLALARRFGAVVPPLVKTSLGMVLDEDDPGLAGRTDEIAAFRDALAPDAKDVRAALEKARRLSDMRSILAGGAVSFADVAELAGRELPDEAERWRKLAELESRYLAALERRGKKDRILAMKSFVPEWPGVEETIRFDDPAAFSDGACPAPDISRIVPCATAADEARRIADYFASVKEGEALPALCVADPEMFPEIVSAFKAKDLTVHNPSKTRLATSTLGRLATQIAALLATRSYRVFSAFIRSGDARRWICASLGIDDSEMVAALEDLDNRQAEFLPETMDDIAPKTRGRLRAIFEFVSVQLRKKGLRRMLAAIFEGRTLDERRPEDREFAAAAEALNRLIDECGDDRDLLALRLDEATYSLEPDEGDVVLTDGWMELPFLEAEELVIAGFQEGCVPESTVGHPYVPDSLRKRLGIIDNAAKEARDRAILRIAVGTRAPDAVRVSFHSISPDGDAAKPSRLLFETGDDRDLVARVKAFYAAKHGTAEGRAYDLPPEWRLRLPLPPESATLERISPTRLDGYLRCPFTYYLRDKNILGDKRMDDKAEELASWEYGNLAHEALEAFGLAPLADSADAGEIRSFLCERVDAQLAERFGSAVPAIVAMQGESVKRRLGNFASVQAERRAAGWRIAAVERKLEITYGHTRFHGKCDRIDRNEATGEWCVIDYKTWDSAAKARPFENRKDGTRAWKSLQLPIYCAMLDVDGSEGFSEARLENISSCYCVLGKTADEVRFTEPVGGAFVAEAEAVLRELVGRIERGIFWPPAATKEWRYDYGDWLRPSPEESVDPAWIEDQARRLEAVDGQGA